MVGAVQVFDVFQAIHVDVALCDIVFAALVQPVVQQCQVCIFHGIQPVSYTHLLPQPNGSICCRFLSGYSAVGSALRSGRRGLEFKSQYSDHSENRIVEPKTA